MSSLEVRALAEFDAVADLDAAHRQQALEVLRANDPELFQAVSSLLRADALPGALETSPLNILAQSQPARAGADDASPSDQRIGQSLGPWRIEAVLGTGGMGTVYRALRDDGQYAQAVAIKCVRREISSPVLAESIRNERDALARLDHPNIATLLDGGIDAGGYPWLAMQLVDGQPIDAYCDAQRLDTRTRVALFDQACEGVAYAHSKVTLHSDIKPSNILVGAGGRPMLIDFGLSSLNLGALGAPRAGVAMTWGYTAPEVMAGEGYSAASDIYALGAVLYRLLCGRWQPAQAELRAAGMARFDPPQSPSRLASEATIDAAKLRSCDTVAAWARELSGDLDRIAMACVDPDPRRRYRSVAELQIDLRRWLQTRPLLAREGEAGYRARLFLRRNRIAVAVSVVMIAALGAVSGLAYKHSRQAAREAQSTREVQRLFEDTLGEMTLTSLGHSPLVSGDMLHVAERRLRERGSADPASVRARGLIALAKSYTTLGDYERALNLVKEARALGMDDPEQRALTQATLAHLFNVQSRYAQAEQAVREGLLDVSAADLNRRAHVVLALDVELARAQWGRARLSEANATLDRALGMAESLAARNPVPLAELLTQRGEWRTQLFEFESARRDLQRAVVLADGRDAVVADSARAELEHTLFAMDERAQALAIAERLLANRRRLLGPAHPETGKAWAVLAEAQYANAQLAPALESAQTGERILRDALGSQHPEVADAMRMVAAVHSQTGETQLGIDEARTALSIMLRAHGPSHQRSIRAMIHLGSALAVKALETPSERPWHEVVDLYQRAVTEGEKQGLPMLVYRVYLIRAQLRIGHTQGIEAELGRVIAGLTRARGAGNDRVLQTRYVLVELLLRQKRDSDAGRELTALLRDADAAAPSLAVDVVRFNSHDVLGDLASSAGQTASAREHWQRAYEIGLRIAGPKEASIRQVGEKLARLTSATGAQALAKH
ncbi:MULTISPECIES: serine/threonine-protein kinase [unclassified Lysobacter]|uniref:serine/threonine-protein kinase n=1 Tax=unclassified Lysobacter TaxID=2635362 RepID=UPI001BE778AF|nr:MULTISPECIES: serine/threonine-protein kinase [unclassified Lysobacter]MBT2749192.1 serine/threonine protein kinase [Lysobacter sp. ISL-42]MBT2754098.1 serine/threonine protein kinase [Lysobacter sp. ISL-50]MBT2779469.1 serine/threonine protein kinase [Lysobacter sp. ISL-54]MBT2781658.1 serine/threonine protein kinase [Lysobacter sp. ISL-52]